MIYHPRNNRAPVDELTEYQPLLQALLIHSIGRYQYGSRKQDVAGHFGIAYV